MSNNVDPEAALYAESPLEHKCNVCMPMLRRGSVIPLPLITRPGQARNRSDAAEDPIGLEPQGPCGEKQRRD